MANSTKAVDQATTTALINAFKQAADDQQTAHNSVSATQSDLVGGWTGVASGKFSDGIGEWMNGLLKIHQALQSIDESMVAFSKLTTSTEDDAAALAAQGELTPSWT